MSQRYMIIEDSPAITAILEDGLSRLGVEDEEVYTFERGDEALAVFSEVEPDVVFLDTSIDGVEPYDAAQAMILEAPRTRIVITTELPDDNEELQEIVAFGAYAVLRKPLEHRELERVVNRIREEHPGAGRIV